MTSIWRFINAPLVVALLSIATISVLLKSCTNNPFREDEARQREVEALGRLQLLSFNEVAVRTNVIQRFVGSVRNNSRFIVSNIQGTVCFYDATNALIDVMAGSLNGLGPLGPGESREFYIERGEGREYAGIPDSVRADGVRKEMKFVSLTATSSK